MLIAHGSHVGDGHEQDDVFDIRITKKTGGRQQGVGEAADETDAHGKGQRVELNLALHLVHMCEMVQEGPDHTQTEQRVDDDADHGVIAFRIPAIEHGLVDENQRCRPCKTPEEKTVMSQVCFINSRGLATRISLIVADTYRFGEI